MVEFMTGDVLATHTGNRNRYVRVGHPDPASPRIWVQDCDGSGFLLGNTGRYVLATTLATRYKPHYRPAERYDRPTTADRSTDA